MGEHVASDHDAVDTHRASLAAVGRTDRVQIELPEEVADEMDSEDVLWLALDGDGGFARTTETLEGTPVVARVVDNRRQAREGDGVDRLQPWAVESGLSSGDSVHLDVLDAGYAYGVRTPGRRVVYDPPAAPDASLADIARQFETE